MKIKWINRQKKGCWEIRRLKNIPHAKVQTTNSIPEEVEFSSEPVPTGFITIEIERQDDFSTLDMVWLFLSVGSFKIPDLIYQKYGKYPVSYQLIK